MMRELKSILYEFGVGLCAFVGIAAVVAIVAYCGLNLVVPVFLAVLIWVLGANIVNRDN